MCKYCHTDWGKRFSVTAIDTEFYIYGGMQIDKGCIDVNVGGSIARFPANYCPICGRELEDTLRVEYQYIGESEVQGE